MTSRTTSSTAVTEPRHVYWLPAVAILAIAALGFGLMWTARDQLPDPLAVHWGPDGRADGFATVDSALVTNVLLTLALPLLLIGLGAGVRQVRLLGPIAVGVAAFMASVLFGGALAQRGLSEPAAADNWWPIGVGALSGIGLATALWLVLRRPRAVAAAATTIPAGAPRLTTAPGTRVAWTGRTARGKALGWFAALGVVPTLALAVWFLAAGSLGGGIAMIVVTALLAVLMTCMWARVTIDQRGVRAVGAGAIRWVHVPLETIEMASVTPLVHPVGEFGGYGVRGGFDGSFGLITAEGPALRLDRAGQGAYFLTVDAPDQAAATVNALLVAARRGS